MRAPLHGPLQELALTDRPPATAARFPALTEHTWLRYAAFTALYAAQGFPYGLLSIAVPAYMAQQGLTPAQIGSYMGIILLPWSLKLINGPLMDRWTLLVMGRRRPWVLLAQTGMIATSFALILLPDPFQHLAWLTALGFILNFFTAFQDVATDGMAIEIIPVEQQARANGFMWGGKTLGYAGATAGGAWMLESSGLAGAMVVHTLLIALVMLVPLLLRERRGERLLPWTQGQASKAAQSLQLEGWRDIGGSLLRTIVLPVSLAAAAGIFVFNLIRGLLNALLPVMTVQELGWQHTQFSELKGAAATVAALIAVVAGGVLVERLGRTRTIMVGTGLLGAAAVAMGLLPALWSVGLTTQAFICAYVVLDVLVTVAFLALMMALCWQRVGATQFSLYMAIANMGLSSGSALLGPLQATLSYSPLFHIVAGCGVAVILLMYLVDLDKHRARVQALEESQG